MLLLSRVVELSQQLQRLPRFGSVLGQVMEEHVAHMRVLGYRYDTSEELLLRFDRFLQRHAELAQLPLEKLVERWSDDQPSPSRLYEAQRVGRLVSKAMHRLDPTVPVLRFGHGVVQAARQDDRRPYLYSDEEIRKILQSALSYPSPRSPLRPLSLFTMLMFAYCAGMRGGEVARLRLGDVDLREETVDVRETKFFKHRRIPLAPGVMAALADYLTARKNAGGPASPQSALFWSPRTGRGYSVGVVRLLLTDVLRQAGVKPPRGAVGPRIHDLRHTMVGHRMRDWYKSGINPQSRLPYLASINDAVASHCRFGLSLNALEQSRASAFERGSGDARERVPSLAGLPDSAPSIVVVLATESMRAGRPYTGV